MPTVPPSDLRSGRRPRIAWGPARPGWGSWEWVGADTAAALADTFDSVIFADGEPIPPCDVCVLVKSPPPAPAADPPPKIVFCPVDLYDSAAAVDADWQALRRCARVVVHCRRLDKFFRPYAPVAYLDHPVKFLAPLRDAFRPDGELLWVGVRTNLPPVVDWVNRHGLPAPLRVLTNPADPADPTDPAAWGFGTGAAVTVEWWSPAAHARRAGECRAALDVKADDFRSRHKPPAKVLDFVASGVPVAVLPGSSAAEHLADLGFDAAAPYDSGRWLSRAYGEDTRRFGAALRELLAPDRVAARWRRLLADVLAS